LHRLDKKPNRDALRSDDSLMNPTFARYIGIDYSSAATPNSSLKGLRVYAADRLTSRQEVEPPHSPRKYWTRRGIAEWLVERLSEGQPTLFGIDDGFSRFRCYTSSNTGCRSTGRPKYFATVRNGTA
jgi:hypothetical protein